MGIQIGDGNKIRNSVIADNGKVENNGVKKKFYERHPILISVIVSFLVGFILLFSFWENIVTWIESLF